MQKTSLNDFSRRLLSIDILRTIAIILMVQIHFLEDLVSFQQVDRTIYVQSDNLALFVAPIFTFLVGASLFMSINRMRANRVEEKQIASRILLRGSLLFVLGMLNNALMWGFSALIAWDIITTIALSIIVVYAISFFSWTEIALIAGVILTTSPFLRILFNYDSYWLIANGEHIELMVRWRLKEILASLFISGYFPLIPWIAFPISGYASLLYLYHGSHECIQKRTKKLLVLGLTMSVLGFSSYLLWKHLNPDSVFAMHSFSIYDYHASTSFILLTLGVAQVLFSLLWLGLDGAHEGVKYPAKPLPVFFNRYSRYSLTAYFIHFAFHLWPLYLIGLILRHDVWSYFNSLGVVESTLITLLFLGLFYAYATLMDRHKRKISLEGLMSWIMEKTRRLKTT